MLAGLQRLRSRGYRIALDDFAAEPDQVAMLPYADFVKIDCRDVRRQGSALVDLARRHGAALVAERVSTGGLVEACRRWGFDLLQGDVLGPAITLAGWSPTGQRADRPRDAQHGPLDRELRVAALALDLGVGLRDRADRARRGPRGSTGAGPASHGPPARAPARARAPHPAPRPRTAATLASVRSLAASAATIGTGSTPVASACRSSATA